MNNQYFDEVHEIYQNRDYTPRKRTLKKRVEAAYPILENIASERELISYRELANKIGTDHRRYIAYVLGTISRIEIKEGKPPLSAVVVGKSSQIPSDGFFNLLESLDYSVPGDTQEEMFEFIRDNLAEQWDS